MTTAHDPLVDALLALQTFEGRADSAETNASYDLQLTKLRKPLPVAVLMHHYHRRQRRKLSITTASRTGACGHCHIAVPRALLLQMSRSGALGTCPQCEGFLYMEPASAADLSMSKAPARKAVTSPKTSRGVAATAA